MKRSKIYKCCVISVLFILLSGLAHADEYSLNNVLDDFIGTYTPVQYDNILSSTRSHYDAMLSNNGQYHDILLLNENICYSNLNFHDGYAIRKNEFDNYNFVTNAKGKFIIDNNGNSYRKISDNIGSSGYADFTSYVLNIIFEDALAFNNVSLEGTKVIIDHIEYTTILDSVFFETDEVSLWMRGQGNTYALVLEGISAKLYKSEREQMTSSVSEDYMMEFPLFFWNDKQYPKINLWNMSQESLRYLRNLIFAKHGYVFRSEDLRELYGGFSWYMGNPSFSENDFSDDEKKLLERIIKNENR